MVGSQLINNIAEFLLARSRRIRHWCSRRKSPAPHQWKEDKDLHDFTSSTLLEEYLKFVVQFGFVTLLFAAFPFVTILSLISSISNLRLD